MSKEKPTAYKYLFLSLLILLIHGCGGAYSLVEFEVLEPARVKIPEGSGNILLMNRAPFSFHSFSEEDLAGEDMVKLIQLDSTITFNLVRGLLEAFRHLPDERFRTPRLISERRADTAFLEDLMLTRVEVESLCDKWGADAIISLEKYTLDVSSHLPYHRVSNSVHWKIYLPGNPKPFDSYTTTDTLTFSLAIDGERVEPAAALDYNIRQLFYESGLWYGRHLFPVWSHAERMLYKGRESRYKDKRFGLASLATDRGDWQMAYYFWEGLSRSNDSSMVAKSLYNMAIYYELEDRLDTAFSLVNQALEYDTLPQIISYRDLLQKRVEDRRRIIQQMGE
jgi:hypothetical protein